LPVSSLLPSRSLSLLPAPSTQNTNPSPFADGVDGRLRQAVVLGRDPDRDRLEGDPDERRRRRRGKSSSVGRVAAFVLARRRRRLDRVELGLDVVGLVMVIGLGGKKETTRRVSTSFIFIFSKPSPFEIGSSGTACFPLQQRPKSASHCARDRRLFFYEGPARVQRGFDHRERTLRRRARCL
jgi:hypothetical protein